MTGSPCAMRLRLLPSLAPTSESTWDVLRTLVQLWISGAVHTCHPCSLCTPVHASQRGVTYAVSCHRLLQVCVHCTILSRPHVGQPSGEWHLWRHGVASAFLTPRGMVVWCVLLPHAATRS